MEWKISVGGKNTAMIQDTVQSLAINPYITIKKVAQCFEIAFTTAQRIIEKLEELSIITQVSPGKRDRLYCASRLLSILEEPTKISDIPK
jgi:ribosomal protein S25